MHLTKEQYNAMTEGFGPCSDFYECRDYAYAQVFALDFETLKDYAEHELACQLVNFDRYFDCLFGDETEEQLNRIKNEHMEIELRIRKWIASL